ncbi:innexin shaking-B isoform X1 [Onthophagus taurus]|uniref:innexin shaking-B isoform X1 n=1 Tax=Onthophagus taurus TaxID=166361 RepID=UPI0039BDD2ED
MFTVKDDPLTSAVSLLGRISADKVQIGSSSLRRSARRSFEEIKRTNSTVEGTMPGLDILRGVYTLTQINHVTIDSLIFRLHSNATVILLVTFSIAVTTRQYVGNPIDCVHTKDIPEDVLNTYCWIHSTYTMMEAFLKRPGYQVPYPGIENSFQKSPGRNQIKQVKYYQWVAFMLFFQAILFYTPRWLWKSWEGGKIHALMMDLDIGICSETEKKLKKRLMLDYLCENFRYHNWWAYKYFICEFLALVNVIGQMFLMNRFFDGAFLTFGIKVIKFMDADEEDRVDPMIQIFPRMTKCTFYKYGVSGEIERHDAICILPLNVVNEKIYVFLWFWFIILACLSAGILVYRTIIILSPRMRVYLLRFRFRLIRKEDLDLIVKKGKMGDWFLFVMLGENVDSIIFRDVIHELATKLRAQLLEYTPGFRMPEP